MTTIRAMHVRVTIPDSPWEELEKLKTQYGDLSGQLGEARIRMKRLADQKEKAVAADRAALGESLRTGSPRPQDLKVQQVEVELRATVRIIEGLDTALDQVIKEVNELVASKKGEWLQGAQREKTEILDRLDKQLFEAERTYTEFTQRAALVAWLQGFPGKPFKQGRPQVHLGGSNFDFGKAFVALRDSLKPPPPTKLIDRMEIKGDY